MSGAGRLGTPYSVLASASVSVTIGTSSISTGLMTQPVTPGGTRSTFSSIFLNSLTRLRSRSSPT